MYDNPKAQTERDRRHPDASAELLPRLQAGGRTAARDAADPQPRRDRDRRVRRHVRPGHHRGRAGGDRRRDRRRVRRRGAAGHGAGREPVPGVGAATDRRPGRAVRPEGGRRGRRHRARADGQAAEQGADPRFDGAVGRHRARGRTRQRPPPHDHRRCWRRRHRKTETPPRRPRPNLPRNRRYAAHEHRHQQVRLRLLRRPPERGQVDPHQRAGGAEDRDRLIQAADHPACRPRHREPARTRSSS